MDGFLTVASAGAKEAMLQQAVNAHNVANASTIGFKADLAQAEAVYVRGDALDTRAVKQVSSIATDLSAGTIQQTGRDLDIAVNGDGWLAVQMDDGTEGLTRRGDLRVDEFGQLTNGAGDLILGEAGPVALPPFDSLTIGQDGTISIVPQGAPPSNVAALDRLKLVNPAPESISKTPSGVLMVEDGLPSVPDASVRLVTGALEGSNVSAVGEMVKMIELAREFEQFMKLVTVGEEVDTASSSLMRLQ
ncbi:MAG: flagellar basal body rod protein FlgF [Pseudomonadota bacterium]